MSCVAHLSRSGLTKYVLPRDGRPSFALKKCNEEI